MDDWLRNASMQGHDGHIDLDAVRTVIGWMEIYYEDVNRRTYNELCRIWRIPSWIGTPKERFINIFRNTVLDGWIRLYWTLFRWSFKPTTWLSPDDGTARTTSINSSQLTTNTSLLNSYDTDSRKTIEKNGHQLKMGNLLEKRALRHLIRKRMYDLQSQENIGTHTHAYIKSLDGDEQAPSWLSSTDVPKSNLI